MKLNLWAPKATPFTEKYPYPLLPIELHHNQQSPGGLFGTLDQNLESSCSVRLTKVTKGRTVFSALFITAIYGMLLAAASNYNWGGCILLRQFKTRYNLKNA